MADELQYEARSRGLTRVLGDGRSSASAFVAGLVGAAAFVASLLTDWQTMTITDETFFFGGEPRDTITLTVGVDVSGYALAYQLGVLGLLTLVGAVVTWPDLARRLRLAAAGLGLGVAGVLVAIVSQLGEDVTERIFGAYAGFGGYPIPREVQEVLDDAIYATEPGAYFGFGAVIALVAGAWLAAGSPRQASAGAVASVAAPTAPTAVEARPDTTADAAPVSPSPVGPPGLPLDGASGAATWPPARVGHADGLTVTASDAIDPGGQPDILRN